MKILVTGGTTFVSRFTASYFALRGYDVYVLNRGSKEQVNGVTLIKGDRHYPGSLLKDKNFDVSTAIELVLPRFSSFVSEKSYNDILIDIL